MIDNLYSLTELDHKDGAKFLTKNPSRVSRVARGSGTLPKEVNELLVQHGKFAQVYQNFIFYTLVSISALHNIKSVYFI